MPASSVVEAQRLSSFSGSFRGKPAGVACIHLDDTLRCRLFGKPERPQVCITLKPSSEMCGTCRDEALQTLARWEEETRPDAASQPF